MLSVLEGETFDDEFDAECFQKPEIENRLGRRVPIMMLTDSKSVVVRQWDLYVTQSSSCRFPTLVILVQITTVYSELEDYFSMLRYFAIIARLGSVK